MRARLETQRLPLSWAQDFSYAIITIIIILLWKKISFMTTTRHWRQRWQKPKAKSKTKVRLQAAAIPGPKPTWQHPLKSISSRELALFCLLWCIFNRCVEICAPFAALWLWVGAPWMRMRIGFGCERGRGWRMEMRWDESARAHVIIGSQICKCVSSQELAIRSYNPFGKYPLHLPFERLIPLLAL